MDIQIVPESKHDNELAERLRGMITEMSGAMQGLMGVNEARVKELQAQTEFKKQEMQKYDSNQKMFDTIVKQNEKILTHFDRTGVLNDRITTQNDALFAQTAQILDQNNVIIQHFLQSNGQKGPRKNPTGVLLFPPAVAVPKDQEDNDPVGVSGQQANAQVRVPVIRPVVNQGVAEENGAQKNK